MKASGIQVLVGKHFRVYLHAGCDGRERVVNQSFLLQELLKKCHQCMETIVKAKDQQAAEANKNASILLKELDLEKVILSSPSRHF